MLSKTCYRSIPRLKAGRGYLLGACAVVCAVMLGELGACACACAGAVRAVRAGSCVCFSEILFRLASATLILVFRSALLRQEELRSHLHNVAIAGRAISWKRLECFVSTSSFVFPGANKSCNTCVFQTFEPPVGHEALPPWALWRLTQSIPTVRH